MPAARLRLPAVSVSVAALLVASGAPASGSPVVSDQDRAFITAAGHGNAFEIAAGRHAAAQAADPAIQDIGNRMVADHTTAGRSLGELAAGLGVPLPDAPDVGQRAVLTVLTSLTGTALDCAYAPVEYFDHVATIGAFEREARHGANPQLRTLAGTLLPTLREHREMIAEAIDDLDCADVTGQANPNPNPDPTNPNPTPTPTTPMNPTPTPTPTNPMNPTPTTPTVPVPTYPGPTNPTPTLPVPTVPVVNGPTLPTLPTIPSVPGGPTPGVPAAR